MTRTRAPIVIPAMAPELKPPESSMGGELLGAAGVDEDGSVDVDCGSVSVVELGEAAGLSASRSAARALKVLSVNDILRKAQEGTSVTLGIVVGNWLICRTFTQFWVQVA